MPQESYKFRSKHNSQLLEISFHYTQDWDKDLKITSEVNGRYKEKIEFLSQLTQAALNKIITIFNPQCNIENHLFIDRILILEDQDALSFSLWVHDGQGVASTIKVSSEAFYNTQAQSLLSNADEAARFNPHLKPQVFGSTKQKKLSYDEYRARIYGIDFGDGFNEEAFFSCLFGDKAAKEISEKRERLTTIEARLEEIKECHARNQEIIKRHSKSKTNDSATHEIKTLEENIQSFHHYFEELQGITQPLKQGLELKQSLIDDLGLIINNLVHHDKLKSNKKSESFIRQLRLIPNIEIHVWFDENTIGNKQIRLSLQELYAYDIERLLGIMTALRATCKKHLPSSFLKENFEKVEAIHRQFITKEPHKTSHDIYRLNEEGKRCFAGINSRVLKTIPPLTAMQQSLLNLNTRLEEQEKEVQGAILSTLDKDINSLLQSINEAANKDISAEIASFVDKLSKIINPVSSESQQQIILSVIERFGPSPISIDTPNIDALSEHLNQRMIQNLTGFIVFNDRQQPRFAKDKPLNAIKEEHDALLSYLDKIKKRWEKIQSNYQDKEEISQSVEKQVLRKFSSQKATLNAYLVEEQEKLNQQYQHVLKDKLLDTIRAYRKFKDDGGANQDDYLTSQGRKDITHQSQQYIEAIQNLLHALNELDGQWISDDESFQKSYLASLAEDSLPTLRLPKPISCQDIEKNMHDFDKSIVSSADENHLRYKKAKEWLDSLDTFMTSSEESLALCEHSKPKPVIEKAQQQLNALLQKTRAMQEIDPCFLSKSPVKDFLCGRPELASLSSTQSFTKWANTRFQRFSELLENKACTAFKPLPYMQKKLELQLFHRQFRSQEEVQLARNYLERNEDITEDDESYQTQLLKMILLINLNRIVANQEFWHDRARFSSYKTESSYLSAFFEDQRHLPKSKSIPHGIQILQSALTPGMHPMLEGFDKAIEALKAYCKTKENSSAQDTETFYNILTTVDDPRRLLEALYDFQEKNMAYDVIPIHMGTMGY